MTDGTFTQYRVESLGVAMGWRPVGPPVDDLRLAEKELIRAQEAWPSQSYRICERTIHIQRSGWRVR